MAIGGVYKIMNTKTGRFYVGSSINIRDRWKAHRAELRGQRHHSLYLQRSWNKFGESAFVFEVIEEVSNRADLPKQEQFWLDVLQPYNGNGYNIRKDARAYYVGGNYKEKLRASAMRPERLANSRKQFVIINSTLTEEQRQWRRENMRRVNARLTPEEFRQHQIRAAKMQKKVRV